MEKRKKTGGRKKATPNKNSIYNENLELIIELLSKGKSQATIVRHINKKIYPKKITTSRLCEFIRDKNLQTEKNHNDRNKQSRVIELKNLKIDLKGTYRIDYKTYKVYLAKHTLIFHSGLKDCNSYELEKIENILIDDYDSFYSIDEVYLKVYQPIYNLIFQYSNKLSNASFNSYERSCQNENCISKNDLVEDIKQKIKEKNELQESLF